MKLGFVASAVIAAATNLPSSDQASLIVKIEHVSPKGGEVDLDLFTAENYRDNDHPTLSRSAPADPAGTTIEIDGLPPGTYAIKMTQDINGNGAFDTNALGMPLEPYGFSHNVAVWLSEPSFEETRFTVGPGRNVITIRLSGTDGVAVPGSR